MRWSLLVAGRAMEGETRLAVLAGLLRGVATGVRYQNAVIIGAVALSIWLLSSRRWRASLLFLLGAVPPLVASAAFKPQIAEHR